MREKGGLGYRPLPRMIDHVPFWYRKRCSSGFYRGKKSIRMTTHARFRYRRPKTDDLKVSVNFSTERDIIFSASPLASAFCFFNKLVASVVVLVAFALGNGCGGDGQYPYQEQQGGGAEYVKADSDGGGFFAVWFPKEEEEEVRERNKVICEKLGGWIVNDGEIRAGPDQDGKVYIQSYCELPAPPPIEKGIFLENRFSAHLAYAGLDWKEHPYRVTYIDKRYMDNMGRYATGMIVIMKNMYIMSGAGELKSCMESYPEYSQVVFQNGECNGQNPMRNYVPGNDKNIISKTDIDDVHKKNKDICNKISGHNYTRGETEIIDNDNVTFTDECKVDIYKEMWTENIIAELFNRKGLDWTELPYKIDFILADKPSGKYKSTIINVKTKNMDIFVTLHKTKSCLLSCPICTDFQIELNPQVQDWGKCSQIIRESEENTSAYFKKDKQQKLASITQSVLWTRQR